MNFFLELENYEVGEVCGVEITDLEKYENSTGFNLPEVLRKYLLLMGKENGFLFAGSHSNFYEQKKYRIYANEKLAANKMANLLAEQYVFLIHGGYQFIVLDLKSEELPVYIYDECSHPEKWRLLYGSLNEFLSKNLIELTKK